MLGEIPAQCVALPGPHGPHLGGHLLQGQFCQLFHRPLILLCLGDLHHIRQGHQLCCAERFARPGNFLHLACRLHIGTGQGGVHPHLTRVGTRIAVGHKHVHMPPLEAACQLPAQHFLQETHAAGQPKGQIQETVVYGLYLQGHLPAVQHCLAAAIARHALHGRGLPSCSMLL